MVTLLMLAGLIEWVPKSQSMLWLWGFAHVSAEKGPVDSELVWKFKNIFFWIVSLIVDDVCGVLMMGGRKGRTVQ